MFLLENNSVKLSSFTRRWVAFIIDNLTGQLLILPLILISTLFPGFHEDGPYFAIFFIPMAIGAYFLVFIYLVSKKGGTPGKLAVGLQIVNEESFDFISIGNALKRVLLKFFISFTFPLSFFFFWENKKHQTIHDKLAKTIIIEKHRKIGSEILDS